MGKILPKAVSISTESISFYMNRCDFMENMKNYFLNINSVAYKTVVALQLLVNL